MLEDRAGKDVQFLADNLKKFMAAARKRPEIARPDHHVPAQRAAGIRRRRPRQGAQAGRRRSTTSTAPSRPSWAACSSTTSTASAASGRSTSRPRANTAQNPENLGQFYVRNAAGDMVPLSALTKFESRTGPEFTMRYNVYRSAQINGGAAPGLQLRTRR